MLMNRHPVFQLVEQYEIKKLPAATYKKSLFTLYGFHYLVKSNYAGYSHDFIVGKESWPRGPGFGCPQRGLDLWKIIE